MVKSCHLILVQVTDMERATRFYRDILGGNLGYASPHWTSLSLGGISLGLHPAIGSPHAIRDVGHKICFETENLDEARKTLTESGVYVAPVDHETPNGRIFDFEDTEGNGFQMMQPQ